MLSTQPVVKLLTRLRMHSASGQNALNNFAMHVGQAVVPALVEIVSRVWSMPRQCSIVACRSWTWTGSPVMLYEWSSVWP